MKSSPLKMSNVWLEALQGPRGLCELAKLQLPFFNTYSFLSCCNTGFSRQGIATEKESKREDIPGVTEGKLVVGAALPLHHV